MTEPTAEPEAAEVDEIVAYDVEATKADGTGYWRSLSWSGDPQVFPPDWVLTMKPLVLASRVQADRQRIADLEVEVERMEDEDRIVRADMHTAFDQRDQALHRIQNVLSYADGLEISGFVAIADDLREMLSDE